MDRSGVRRLLTGAVLGVALPASAQTLYDNGPLITTPPGACLPPGGMASEVHPQNSNLAYNQNSGEGYRVADDFTIAGPGSWNISAVTIYGYQRGSGTTSTFTSATLRIWSGPPGEAGSAIIFGDTTTNRLSTSTFTNIYRYGNGSCSVLRPVMESRLSVGLVLGPGTYWLDWAAAGSLPPPAGPWAPPVTYTNLRGKPGANARQYQPDLSTWVDLVEGSPFPSPPFIPQDLPFLVQGTVVGGPCYANCDGSTSPPVLNVSDFICFQTKFAAGDSYANCDGSTTPPILNVSDFICFQTRFAAGCTGS